uniref:Uncharacterized protein n=1 Tax=Timema cristinae TaxID=61476 RepID=A0A7R9DIR5_TIMCR|nr:unnamed protein product [Timema cristinae]
MSFDALENWLNSDYWDTYGLYAGLKDHGARAEGLLTCVWAPSVESGEAMCSVPVPLLEAFNALHSNAVLTQPSAFSPQDPTDASLNSIPNVWGELDVIDRLICIEDSSDGRFSCTPGETCSLTSTANPSKRCFVNRSIYTKRDDQSATYKQVGLAYVPVKACPSTLRRHPA